MGLRTVEAAALTRELQMPLVVALNKTDTVGASQLAAVHAQLQRLPVRGDASDGSGGDTASAPVVVETSARTGDGVEALRAALADAVAANQRPAPPPEATVEEAVAAKRRKKRRKKRRRGGMAAAVAATAKERGAQPATPRAVASVVEVIRSTTLGTLLVAVVREGTIRLGDWYCCGLLVGRVRVLVDESEQSLTCASRGMAVAVAGVRRSVVRPSLLCLRSRRLPLSPISASECAALSVRRSAPTRVWSTSSRRSATRSSC